MESLEHAVIRLVHKQERPFARHEILRALAFEGRNASRARTARTLEALRRMKLLVKYPIAYQYKQWHKHRMPEDVDLLITMYDAWMVLHKGEVT